MPCTYNSMHLHRSEVAPPLLPCLQKAAPQGVPLFCPHCTQVAPQTLAAQVRAEAEMRVVKMEVFELKSAEAVRSNTMHRESHALVDLQAENKAQAAELAKLRWAR